MRRPPRDHVLADFVNADDRATILVVASDDAADLQGHLNSLLLDGNCGEKLGNRPSDCQISDRLAAHRWRR
jgi:hypothetical protein